MRRHHHHRVDGMGGLRVRQDAAPHKLLLAEAVTAFGCATVHQKCLHRMIIQCRRGEDAGIGGVLIGAPNAFRYAKARLVSWRHHITGLDHQAAIAAQCGDACRRLAVFGAHVNHADRFGEAAIQKVLLRNELVIAASAKADIAQCAAAWRKIAFIFKTGNDDAYGAVGQHPIADTAGRVRTVLHVPCRIGRGDFFSHQACGIGRNGRGSQSENQGRGK